MEPPAKRQALANVTVEDADALGCGICYLPLKPPILPSTFPTAVSIVFYPCQYLKTDWIWIS